jgi:hypothetical protein
MKKFFINLLEVYCWIFTIVGLVGTIVGGVCLISLTSYWILGVICFVLNPATWVALNAMANWRLDREKGVKP